MTERDNAMRMAVHLARTGQFNNWWAVAARLRARQVREEALDWTEVQRKWLDSLCLEADEMALPSPSVRRL